MRRPRPNPLLSLAAVALAALGFATPGPVQGVAAQAASAFPPDSAILAILQERVDQKRSPGLVVGLREADGTTRFVAWGDPGPGQPPLDRESVFEIGSITKVFTGTVLADMALAGEVSLDDPVEGYLPAGVTMPERNGKAITLGMLAQQNSALPRMPDNFAPADPSNPYVDYGADQLYAFLEGYELPRDPGESFEYSNLGVGLLGHVLSLRAGLSYRELVRDRILEPLGMTHTGVQLTPWMREHLALGHGEGGGVVPNWDLDALAGAGALRSTAEDMLRFLAAATDREGGRVHEALALALEGRAEADGDMQVGLNWIRRPVGSDTIVWHNGGTGGYRSFAGIVPSRRVGVVVLTNSGGAGADDVGFHLLHPELPLAPPPAPPREFTKIDLPADVLARYTGTYELSPDFRIEVTLDDGALWGQATGQGRLRLWPYTERDFFLEEVNALITFEADASGEVVALVLHQGGRDQRGRRVRPPTGGG